MPIINAPTNTTPREDLQGSFVKGNLPFMTSATQILRPLPISRAKGAMDVINRTSTLQRVSNGIARSRSGGFKTANIERTEVTFRTQTYGIKVPYDAKDRADYQDLYDYEKTLSDIGQAIVYREQEARLNTFFNASDFASGTRGSTPSNPWSDPVNGTPRADVASARETRYKATGLTNGWYLACTFMTLLHLKKSNDMWANRKYGQYPQTEQEKIRAITEEFEVAGLILVGGRYNAAGENLAESMDDLWTPTKAALVRVAETDDPSEPCVGRTFYNDQFGGLMTVSTYFDNDILSDQYLSYQDVTEKALDLECGHVFYSIAS